MVPSELPPFGKIELSRDMVITPLAAESLGVRSLAIHVQTADTSILIDPGVALGFRYGLHPHPEEYKLLSMVRKKISNIALSTDLLVVSHYHHDHFMAFFQNYAYFWSSPEEARGLYENKQIWCKDIRRNINFSQQRRGYNFVRGIRKVTNGVIYADGRAHKEGNTLIRFSPAVPHGEEGTHLGWVIMTTIRCGGFVCVHASDVQGPMVKKTAEWILAQKPDVVILAGPPTYLSPERVAPKVLTKAAENLEILVNQIPVVIIDHHLLRDVKWLNWLEPIRKMATANGHQLLTVSEVLGVPEQLFEAQREKLYQESPANSAFNTWVEQIYQRRIQTPPPLGT
ncbi:MAG: hypothetical protein ACFFD8_04375 [Candidatus Thorarchaeota archaeon]